MKPQDSRSITSAALRIVSSRWCNGDIALKTCVTCRSPPFVTAAEISAAGAFPDDLEGALALRRKRDHPQQAAGRPVVLAELVQRREPQVLDLVRPVALQIGRASCRKECR